MNIKKKYFYRALLLTGTFLLSTLAMGQNQQIADSLIHYLERTPSLSDSTRWMLYYNISINTTSPAQELDYAKKAFKIGEKENDLNKLGTASCLIGEGLRAQGKLVEALNSFYQSIKYYQQTDNLLGVATVYSHLASTYAAQENSTLALNNYSKAIHIFREKNDRFRLAAALQNKGDVFTKLDLPDSAESYFFESIQLFKEEGFEVGVAYNLGNLGLIEARKEDFRSGESKIREAFNILEKYEDYYGISDFANQLAEIYLNKGKPEEALRFALKSLDLASQDGFKEQIRDANLILSKIFADLNEFEKAYKYHTQYLAYRDSINNEEVIRKMADLRTEYEVSQKQAEIDLLMKQRQINYMIGLGLAFITLLLGALAFVLFRNNRIKQTTNKILTFQKEELEMQQDKLEALNNTKDRFFSIISHDLRGPVNAFNGISELIKHYIACNEMAQLREVSEYIDKSARQLSTLLNNLLDWSIKQQGAFPFHPEKVHLNPLLEEIMEMFGITAHSKKIILTVNLEEDIYVWADRNSLHTILRNLVNNALKFTDSEGLVTISAYSQKAMAFINVIDTGIGIPEEKLDRIFDVKDKTYSRGTAGEKGLGIGLNLAYEFAQMNKGTIIANSEEQAGTIFTVKIPLYSSSEQREAKQFGKRHLKAAPEQKV